MKHRRFAHLLKILGREEEHADFLERQFDLIKQIGIER